MNKRGYIQDWLLFGIIIIITAILFVAGTKIYNEINDNFQDSDMSTGAKAISDDGISRFSTVWDTAFIGIFFVFALGIIVSFYVIDTHPALFFPIIIIFAIILVTLAILANVYQEFSEEPDMASTATDFEGLSWIMNNFVIISVVLGFLGIIALFAKFQSG